MSDLEIGKILIHERIHIFQRFNPLHPYIIQYFDQNNFKAFETHMEAALKHATGDVEQDREVVMAALKDSQPDPMNLALFLLKKSIQKSGANLSQMPAASVKLLLNILNV